MPTDAACCFGETKCNTRFVSFCPSVSLLQDLTESVMALKNLRDEVSSHQSLGESQAQAEVLLHEHQAREAKAKVSCTQFYPAIYLSMYLQFLSPPPSYPGQLKMTMF